MIKIIFFFILYLLSIQVIYATHNRAGEIRYTQINDLTIKAELITYTKTSSTPADRDSVVIMWGDGTSNIVPRKNGKGLILSNDVKMNIYEMEHTYPGRGEYLISMLDPNRVENILNVDPPGSVNIPFFVQTKIKLFNTNFQGINHSPILTNPPVDIACLGQKFIHNPGAIDLDGDSLSFELITPLLDIGTNVPNYLLPNQIRPGINNTISFDQKNGTFFWDAPQLGGEYNIAIAIHEYRKGQLISTTIRDMQILVLKECAQDSPPSIQGGKDTCIIAGETLDLNFLIDDPDKNSRGGKVKVQTFGAPFLFQPSATTNATGRFDPVSYILNIHWKTECSHVSSEYYNIIIKATDDYYDTSGLSNIFLYRIKVIGPAPSDLRTTSTNSSIRLDWKLPYSCDSLTSNFKGFSLWRKENPGPNIDTCITGLEKYGY
ncbi:MAG: gliding motility-associated C-terminal domain-containing protein, partial [Saprospiraceae bacterium]